MRPPSLTLALAVALAPAWRCRLASGPYVDVGSPTSGRSPSPSPAFQARRRGARPTRSPTWSGRPGPLRALRRPRPEGLPGRSRRGATRRRDPLRALGRRGRGRAGQGRRPREGGDLVGELHLYEVRAGREVLATTLRVPAGDARALGHRMADEIVRYYTREPGIFSTRIAAIRKTQRPLPARHRRRGRAEPAGAPRREGHPAAPRLAAGRQRDPPHQLPHRAARAVGLPPRRPVVSFASRHRGNSMGGVYSPDGKRIAFCLTEGPNTDVWAMNADGSGARRLTKDPAIDVSPTWSADGTSASPSSPTGPARPSST